MPFVSAYHHVTVVEVPRGSWEELMYSLSAWKGFLQPFPGFFAVRLAARALPEGTVRVHVTTIWEFEEQLRSWLRGDSTPRTIVEGLSQPGTVVDEQVLEELS